MTEVEEGSPLWHETKKALLERLQELTAIHTLPGAVTASLSLDEVLLAV